MPFVPHTQAEVRAMLDVIGASDIEHLFSEIPKALRGKFLDAIPSGLSEMALRRLLTARANADSGLMSFMGAGAYEHHIPAAVWEIATRGEFYTAYTPYQAEASQGTLQLLYEYQTMMARLTRLDVSNASMYDGASALAESILMAIRLHRSAEKCVLLPKAVHPAYRRVAKTILQQQGITCIEIDFAPETGTITIAALEPYLAQKPAALVIPSPNFFGMLEEIDILTDWAHDHDLFVIGLVNPMAMALLKPPGEWGTTGADLACGEGQPLGIPLASGGPYFGFLTCKQAYVRQMPGRIVGRTTDQAGRQGFTLTLQAREQHIRRAKATSNICTNQGLMVTAATIYLSLMGGNGLARVAKVCHAQTQHLVAEIMRTCGVTPRFRGSYFHECVVELPTAAQPILDRMTQLGVLGGYALEKEYGFSNAILICATETKTQEDITHYVNILSAAINI